LPGAYGLFLDGDVLYAVDWRINVKLFTKRSGKYAYQRSFFLDPKTRFLTCREIAVWRDRLFMAGTAATYDDQKQLARVRAFDLHGQFLKTIVTWEPEPDLPLEDRSMDNFMRDNLDLDRARSRLYYMRENNLEVTVINPDTMEVERKAPLARPRGYRPMPEGLYTVGNERKTAGETYHFWRTSYSSVANALVSGEYWVVQVRTDRRPKRFATMFYRSSDFSLVKQIDLDHFLVANKGKQLYFYENGEPGIDDDAGPFRILKKEIAF
jgi:hypothetical protein